MVNPCHPLNTRPLNPADPDPTGFDHMEVLPKELLLRILEKVDIPSPLVNKTWNQLIKANPPLKKLIKAVNQNESAYVEQSVPYIRLKSDKEELALTPLELCKKLIQERIAATEEIQAARGSLRKGNGGAWDSISQRFNEKFSTIYNALKLLNTNEIDLKTALKEPNGQGSQFTGVSPVKVDPSVELIHHFFLIAIEFNQVEMCQLLLNEFDYNPSLGGRAAYNRAKDLDKPDILKLLEK